jgi:hypothetical protein
MTPALYQEVFQTASFYHEFVFCNIIEKKKHVQQGPN